MVRVNCNVEATSALPAMAGMGVVNMSQVQSFQANTWVDVFSGSNFKGRLHRLCSNASKRSMEFRETELPRFRSLIVGPGAIAEVHVLGRSRPIRLSPKTMLRNASRRLRGDQVQSVVVASAQ